MDYEIINRVIEATGMICRGGFHPVESDAVPVRGQTAIMVGNRGPEFWRAFFQIDAPAVSNPLEKWTESVLSDAALELDCAVLLPFVGPPYHPFLAWAQRADNVFPSPIGPLIHPEFGLWHAYRGLLVFDDLIKLPPRGIETSPCDSCAEKYCLTACPVDAVGSNGDVSEIFNMPACLDYLSREEGRDCLGRGCLARRACPVGAAYLYEPEQANFHMAAFYAAYGPGSTKE